MLDKDTGRGREEAGHLQKIDLTAMLVYSGSSLKVADDDAGVEVVPRLGRS